MGFFFRKSVGFGPFRVNFSKSGIGVSAGIKGARISTGPRGTYVNAGTNGFYYRQKINTGSSSSSNARPASPNYYNQVPNSSNDVRRIHSADVSSFVSTSNSKLVDQINEASNESRFAPLAGICTALLTLALLIGVWEIALVTSADASLIVGVGFFIALMVLICGIYLTWKIHRGDELKRTTPLFYELEPDTAKRFEEVTKAVRFLAHSARMWRVQSRQSNWDWKRNAGASSIITRTAAVVCQEQPPYIATNVSIWALKLSDQTLYFLPDYIFVRQSGRYGAISYDSLLTEFAPTRFIEEQGVPPDTRVLNYTWKFVNKKGGPDRRFSNNHQIPVVEYGFVHLATASGLNIHLHVSSVSAASNFAGFLHLNQSGGRPFSQPGNGSKRSAPEGRPFPGSENESRVGGKSPYIDPELKKSFVVLGIEVDSTSDQITSAYRNLAKMYHPDRVSHLAPEFIGMAEERMKEINVAYDILKKHQRV